MKIAVWHNLPSGGGKRALYYHVRGLVARGHTVEVWCPPTADQTYLPLSDLVREHVVPLDLTESPPRGPIGRALEIYRKVSARIVALHAHCRQCAQEIDQGDFDLLFANSCLVSASSPMARYAQTPAVLYLQEPCRPLYEACPKFLWADLPAETKAWWRPRDLKMFCKEVANIQAKRLQAHDETENAKAYRALLVNSFFSRESVLRAYGVDARVCYLGVDTDLFTDRRRKREDFLIGLGMFSPTKNIRFVLEALALVPPPRPRLIWVGNVAQGRYLEQMQQFAQSAGVEFEPKVRVSDDELVELLNRAFAMVYASRLEPFGFAPLEANACGTPVIAAAEGGIRETVQDGRNGLLLEPDPAAMAAAIQRLRNDDAFACQLGQQARRLVKERWSLAASLDRLEGQFAWVLDKARQDDPGLAPRLPRRLDENRGLA